MHTVHSATGSWPRLAVQSGHLESAKWLGFVLMLVDHIGKFWEIDSPYPYLFGRAVFPLFALALGFGIAHMSPAERGPVVLRLCLWGVATVFTVALLTDPAPLNILFTFAIGITLHTVFTGVGKWRRLTLAALLFASLGVEYSIWGTVGVALIVAGARDTRPLRQWLTITLGVVVMAVPSVAVGMPLLGLVFFLALVLLDLKLPRIPRVFYPLYCGHWAVLAAAKVLT